jgi:hypothetical protein
MKASLIYDQASGGYSLKFDIDRYDREGWNKLKLVTGALKATIPASDRDYDPTSYTWFFHEKHFKTVRILVENGCGTSNVFVMEKPEEQTATAVFVALDVDVTKFLNYVGAAAEDEIKDFDKAKKFYRKAALKFHPDRNPNGAADMSALNEVWNRLQKDYWKVKEMQNA